MKSVLKVTAAFAARRGCLPAAAALRLAYDNADTYLRWRAEQLPRPRRRKADELDERIDEFFAWHRRTALPQYARISEEAAKRVDARALARGPRLGLRFPGGAGAAKPALRRRAGGAAARPPDAAASRAHGEAVRGRQPQVRARVPARQRSASGASAAPGVIEERLEDWVGNLSQRAGGKSERSIPSVRRSRRAARPRPPAHAGRVRRHDPQARSAEAPARAGSPTGSAAATRRIVAASERFAPGVSGAAPGARQDARAPSSATAQRPACGATPRTSGFSRAAPAPSRPESDRTRPAARRAKPCRVAAGELRRPHALHPARVRRAARQSLDRHRVHARAPLLPVQRRASPRCSATGRTS